MVMECMYITVSKVNHDPNIPMTMSLTDTGSNPLIINVNNYRNETYENAK